MGKTRTFLRAIGAVVSAALLLVSAGCSGDDGAITPASSTVSSTAPSTTTTAPSTTTGAPGTGGGFRPPGRLPFVDATAKITALIPPTEVMADSRPLAAELARRVAVSLAATGFAADVRGVSLVDVVRAGHPVGSVAASVIEIRNREESGDDTSPGYDLVVTMERSDVGNWTISRAEEQRICSRGASTSGGAPVCV